MEGMMRSLGARLSVAVWCAALAAGALGQQPAGDDAQAQLIEAVRAGDGAKVAQLLAAGADPSRKHGTIGSPLTLAVQYGDPAVLRAFVAQGADLTRARPELRGWTPLEYLLLRDDVPVELVKALLEAGAKVKDTEWAFVPPAVTSGARNNGEVMRALLEAGADPNARSADAAWSALEMVVIYGEPGAVRALLEAGAKTAASPETGRTTWHALAARQRADGATEIARALKTVESGSIDAPGVDGWTPMQLAVYAQSAASIRALAGAGASVNRTGAEGWTPLMYGAAIGMRRRSKRSSSWGRR